MSDELAGLHVLWGHLPKSERQPPPPARELASRTPAQKLPMPGDPSLPMTLLPSLGKPSLTFMLAVCIKSAPLSHSTWFCFPQHLAPP